MQCEYWSGLPDYNDECRTPIESELKVVTRYDAKTVWDKPTEMNKKHKCVKYKEIGWWGKLERSWFHGIPMSKKLEDIIKGAGHKINKTSK